jgi:ABC-type branched-subunit amino acid transport system ATPase component
MRVLRRKQKINIVLIVKRNDFPSLRAELQICLKHADRAYIVDNGAIKYQRSITELEKNEEVKKRYLAV